ncbi:hypothetical protein P43SY_003405 [Pythium insidiosum]|uniref:Dynamin N-terminal domain-containing protein n=1 Tax=Pythium insidiosum TaxID=114742 RepID=A0AAD5LIU6_PYTIN|nr:hypothetical protein P43SY_003405 [Pythium insidiosum]
MTMNDWEDEDALFSFIGAPDAAPAPSLERLATVQRLLHEQTASIHEQLHELHERLRRTSPELPPSLDQSLTNAARSTELLRSRIQRNCVSVLITGTPNAGKSALVNAMAGALVSPIADVAATASLLRITTTGSDVYRLHVDSGDHSDEHRELLVVESRSSARVYRTVERLHREMRSDSIGAERRESKLLLGVPRSLSVFVQGPVTIELVDSPGARDELSPDMNDMWPTAISGSDVLVVVLAWDQLETPVTARFWQRLRDTLPSRVTAKSLLVFLNKCDAPVTATCEQLIRTREQCQRVIRSHTNGSLEVPTERIFVGSARKALVAQLAIRLDPTMSAETFSNEHAELASVAQETVGAGWEQRFAPESVRELRAMEDDWATALETSGFVAFQRALHSKTRAAAMTHLYKLLSTVDSVATRVRGTYESFVTKLHERLLSYDTCTDGCDSALVRLRLAQQSIQEYVDDVVSAREAAFRQSFRRELASCLDDSRVRVPEATSRALCSLPPVFSADDTHQLAKTLDVFCGAVHGAVAQLSVGKRHQLHELLRWRRELLVSSHSDIQKILRTLGIVLQEHEHEHQRLPEPSSHAPVDARFYSPLLCQLDNWVLAAIDRQRVQLQREVKRVARLRVEPGSEFIASHDFRTNSSSACVKLVEGYANGDGHAKLVGAGQTLSLSCVVDEAFTGQQAFTLELEHLASDVGDASRASVTVCVNGHVIREAFCPRAMHERNGGERRLWSFAKDRWHVPGSLRLSDEHTRLLDHVLNETSPTRELQHTCGEYVEALERLVRSRVEAEKAIDAYTSAIDACDAIVARCAELLETMTQVL